MIKKMLLVKKNVDISSYSKLISFITNKNVGQIRKKAKVFTRTEMDRFLTSAPDDNCLHLKEGKCSNQAIGINSMGYFPKQIAERLELPETDSYTGHSFRRTSTTIPAGTKVSMSTVKRHGGWRNPSCVEEYMDESEEVRQEISC
ncbi:hypothetical protein QAD02_005042 [Eretmocerus hayati]|uniref:Uncharacterized protein n=1 Tax=Eretmocerus hayati TaxID=131215 RepID=A0ACC2NR78_9HYME|nr:hypothetical protein QAD02_005042 [Eretmocerus hayati]